MSESTRGIESLFSVKPKRTRGPKSGGGYCKYLIPCRYLMPPKSEGAPQEESDLFFVGPFDSRDAAIDYRRCMIEDRGGHVRDADVVGSREDDAIICYKIIPVDRMWREFYGKDVLYAMPANSEVAIKMLEGKKR